MRLWVLGSGHRPEPDNDYFERSAARYFVALANGRSRVPDNPYWRLFIARRHLPVPLRFLLVFVCDVQKFRFGKMATDDL